MASVAAIKPATTPSTKVEFPLDLFRDAVEELSKAQEVLEYLRMEVDSYRNSSAAERGPLSFEQIGRSFYHLDTMRLDLASIRGDYQAVVDALPELSDVPAIEERETQKSGS